MSAHTLFDQGTIEAIAKVLGQAGSGAILFPYGRLTLSVVINPLKNPYGGRTPQCPVQRIPSNSLKSRSDVDGLVGVLAGM